jgi:hypothetical protein
MLRYQSAGSDNAEAIARSHARFIAENTTLDDSAKGSGYASTAADRDAVCRQAGLTCTFAQLVAEAAAQNLRLPGHVPPSGPHESWLRFDAAQGLRAWAKEFAPAFIDPTADHPNSSWLWW